MSIKQNKYNVYTYNDNADNSDNAYIREHIELQKQDFGLVEWLAGVDFRYRWVIEGQGHGHGQGRIRRGLLTLRIGGRLGSHSCDFICINM